MQLLEILKEFLALFGNIIIGYFTYGWFFAMMHALVGYLIYRSWRGKLQLETYALRHWVPPRRQAAPDSEAGETTQILDRFVQESQRLGPQGFFVPMTDYSDRLDSIIDGMVAELHDRTNLFILVGIAGTLFGVFEFAFRSHEVALDESLLPGVRVQKLGEFLSESMSKAFPVGFMGLLLTFFSQIIAGIPERKLREALSKATREALKCREQHSISQAEIVRDSANAIREAMKPVSGLEATLTQSLQPVVHQFGERLDQSLKLVTLQFNQLQEATDSIHRAVKSVDDGIGKLKSAAGSLEALLKDTPEVLKGINKTQQRQQESLDQFDKSLQIHLGQAEQINDGLNRAAEGLIRLPQELVDQTRSTLDSVGKDSVIAWQTMAHEFGKQLYSDYSSLLSNISAQATNIKDAVAALSLRLNDVSENASTALTSLNQLPAGVLAGLETSFGGLSSQCLNVWTETSKQFGSDIQGTYINYLQTIESEANKVRVSLDTARDSWGRLATNANTFLKDAATEIVGQARQELEGSLKNLEHLLDTQLPGVSKEVQGFKGGLEQLLGHVQAVQKEYALWLESARTAQDRIRDIHSDLIRVRDEMQRDGRDNDNREVFKLLQNNTEELKATNRLLEQIQNRIPSSSNGIHSDLQSSISLLKEIRRGIHDLAYKESMFTRVANKLPWSRTKK